MSQNNDALRLDDIEKLFKRRSELKDELFGWHRSFQDETAKFNAEQCGINIAEIEQSIRAALSAAPAPERRDRSPYGMTVAELQRRIGEDTMALQFKVLGDPSKGVTNAALRTTTVLAEGGWA